MVKKNTTMLMLACALTGVTNCAVANDNPDPGLNCGTPADYKWLTAALGKSTGQPASIQAVASANALSLCEVRLDSGNLVYSRPGDKTIMVGRLYEVSNESIVDLTQFSLEAANQSLLKTISKDDYVAYSPNQSAKAFIYVMTDVDCAYCRKLHKEIPDLNKAGIEVRYLPYVRSSRQGSAWDTMSNIWCSAGDRKSLLDEAMAGKKLERQECGEPVLDRYQDVGRQTQLQGTPHILFSDGRSQSGSSTDLVSKVLKSASNLKENTQDK
ncbi:DsbC family protein [Pseudomonas sp. GXZC]|uniref:DsbC family protein n=1 Tax=Pseudomonas sp. GXZC TaxID=3003351 RepID=UPI0022AA7816|nr:DsbC family protein [Pseudomonas sp. GXZC]WAT32154.1 DsbC family protein [Pseudomonas sp. GXZC]